ncbi:bestrophin-2-like [Ptychodera flava]|uniref:bestrophin-2-like n=1 Tax=Ptychodera flava TaxID=63121 RepID=UPI00396A0DD8
MTVSYSLRVSEAKFFGFTRLLATWRGSIYKLLWQEVVIFLITFYGLGLLYRLALNDEQRTVFEHICMYAKEGMSIIPLSFILGFYVALVVGRWWNMYMSVPWIDEFAQLVASNVHGEDERGRTVRRTLVRWLNITTVSVLRAVSIPVLTRFPTFKHLLHVGLLTEEEYKKFEELPTPHTKFWLPCLWACNLVTKLRQEGRIQTDLCHRYLLERIQAHRQNCQDIMSYDWVSIPLVYTQVVTIACISYFVSSVFGRQFLDPSKGYESYKIDLYFPILATLEFFFYFGWLKVAQAILNPYGGDDDDFELNYIIDRNVQVGFSIVDRLHGQMPSLVRDKHWDSLVVDLPYTKSSMKYKKRRAWYGSTNRVSRNAKDEFIIEDHQTMPVEDDGHLEDYPESFPAGSTGNIQGEIDMNKDQQTLEVPVYAHDTRSCCRDDEGSTSTDGARVRMDDLKEQKETLLSASPLETVTEYIDESEAESENRNKL